MLRHFTRTELANIRLLKSFRLSNEAIGRRWRREPAEIDIALFALIGRTPEEASSVLCRRTS